MQHSSIWIVALAAATCLTGAAWAEHGGEGGHGQAGGHGAPPVFATPGASHSGSQASERNSTATRGASAPEGRHSGASMNFVSRITNNPNLSARLQPLLPAGTTLEAAAMGFRNQGQFIAALHAAQNLNISFDQLKSEMTGPAHDSLGQAIHDLVPNADAQTLKADVTLARQQARTDLQAAKAAKEAAEEANEANEEAAETAAKGSTATVNSPTGSSSTSGSPVGRTAPVTQPSPR